VVELGSDWDILYDAGLMKRLLASSACYPFPSGCVFFSILREVEHVYPRYVISSPTPILLLANVVPQYSTVGEESEASCS